MWLLSPIGFFSIVQKSDDIAASTLTIRARAAGDLDALRSKYLPTLGATLPKAGTDYPFRAKAPAADVADAMARLTKDTAYSNFKDEVKKRQGSSRAAIYSKVWHSLLSVSDAAGPVPSLAEAAASKPKAGSVVPAALPSAVVHPKHDDNGKVVKLKSPSAPSPLSAWTDAEALARVVPGGPMPKVLNGVSLSVWADRPSTPAGWEALAAQHPIPEPVFKVPAGKAPAAGAVVQEPDGRYWIVHPSNTFGGYAATFPKGSLDGMSAQATAIKEVFEESGLQVRLISWLIDTPRTTSYTRYYLAERVGGTPADMGWESQAVSLLPKSKLTQVLTNAADLPLLKSLLPVEQ